MRLKIFTIIQLVLSLGLASGQENPVPLDFHRALELVYANDYVLKAKSDDIIVSEYRVKEAISEYYPKLAVYSNVTKTSLDSEIELPNLFGPVIDPIRLFPQERYNFGIIARYELYTFGRRSAANSIARMGLEISKLENREYKNALYDKTARAFSAAITARNILAIQRQNIKRAEEKLRIIEDRLSQGLAAEYDRLAAKILISKYRERENRAGAEFQKAKIKLKSLTDWKYPYEFMPSGELSGLPAALPESTLALPDSAMTIKMMKLGRDIKNREKDIRKSVYFPEIGVFSKYDWQNGYQPDIDKIRGDWSVGFSLEWLILDGGLRKSRLRRLEFEAKKSDILLAGARSNLVFAAESAVIEIEKSSRDLALARERLELADRGIRIAQSRYNLGLLGISDLIDMDLDKSEAEIAVATADHELLMARLEYKKALDFYPETE